MRRVSKLLLVGVGAVALGAIAIPSASFADGGSVPSVQLRSNTDGLHVRYGAANVKAKSVDTMKKGEITVVNCWVTGQKIYGDNIWYAVGAHDAYVSGYYLDGKDPNPNVKKCGS